MHTANDDLARARHAFELWRAKRQRRTRIPPELWDKAVALLADHPITRVARALRLDPAELRKRRLAAHLPLMPNSAPQPRFLQVPASDLSPATAESLTPDPRRPRRTMEAAWRLQIERADGHRLTLSVTSSEWAQVEALYSLFLRA